MGRADYLELGGWNVQCYQCGRKRKASMLKKHWQGYWVCPEHWEPRHPQDFVRNITDNMTPAWSQPQPAPQFRIPVGAFDVVTLTDEVSVSVSATVPSNIYPIFSFGDGTLNTGLLGGGILNGPEATLVWIGDLSAESVTVEEQAVGIEGAVTDLINITESAQQDIQKIIYESVAMSESVAATLNKAVSDGVLISESINQISIRISDSIIVGESMLSNVSKQLTDYITTAESISPFILTLSQINGTFINGAALNAN